ncbi:MAG: helix-turn-helix transcriptional regulator [Phycisphaerales bacterium]|nr:helix-turn-helix transcriptional regulator [Phycisphaerales bacterium]
MTSSPSHFGTMLREKRLEKGYSLRRFAEMIGVSPTYLSLVETGNADYPPAADRVKKMAELLGADPEQWIALAGRVSEESKEIILDRPDLMPALLRAARGLSAEKLKRLIEDAKRQSQEDDAP